MLPIVTHRRRPNSAMAWLLVIAFLPVFGLILYFLIGENQLPRRRVGRHARLRNELREMRKRFEHHPALVLPDPAPETETAITLAERLAYMPILGGNRVDVMTSTSDVIDRLVADIDAAIQHVHILFYIYADDATGRRVADALARAVQRGVKCRMLIDAVGSRPFFKTLAEKIRADGVELHAMLPVQFFRRQAARFDLRNHRKLAIVDGRIAYTGSQNIVDANYGHKNLAWHDMMLRLTGPILLELQSVFLEDWYFESNEVLESDDVFPDPEVTGNVPAQTLPSGPSYPIENYQRVIVASLYAARRKVIITTPYLVPDEPLMQAIQVAALRGVEVNVILPEKSDQILVGAAARGYFEDLMEAGAKLYLYQSGLLHAKTMSIDDSISLVGTGNFDIRSFALNFELNLLLYGSDFTGRLRAAQENYMRDSVVLDAAEWRNRSRAARLFQQLARLVSPLL